MSHRYDPRRVDLRMARIVVDLERDSIQPGREYPRAAATHLDMVKLSGVLEGRVLPIEILKPSVDLGVVVPDHASTFLPEENCKRIVR